MKYEKLERLYDAITDGRITRDPATYGYVDSSGRIHNPDLALYELEDKGYVRLHLDGRIEILPAGEAWRNRPRKPGKLDPAFSDAGPVTG
ncbi:hypothetical protein [Micromonospora carbonacea]|uniref:Uncharacterized protein n=1 Tax=Micromonospora carbonacea TaxID=47853 RepID=A0A1C5ACM1_9ACTN|nr:hypothetical protein [Micromonospora carbonacea]SCF42987.1 hypothetical protein GA0070563_112169 [Micromonospora carbonacea]